LKIQGSWWVEAERPDTLAVVYGHNSGTAVIMILIIETLA
jgi:hypothetical protein